ncbi:TIGR01841 family phasin [Pseudoduganella umbonata]|uniref:Phasin family protein n=1 Tax=Pseudoduganella umbonata TaxID=864828 RepID=A0A4P8HZG7_9BURK|nr:TIGR01841 family phasin [Pseudoduganella umbonata]MBB3224024.1 phasin family protein [Pseudoduganella umbonata]QCP14100.1 phasin family protein [Pseudoduganella umbonata]
MSTIPEQFSNAAKANLDNQFTNFSALTSKAFEGFEKLIALNLATAKASLEGSSVTAKQLLSASNPQEFFSLSTAQAQPAAEKFVAYGRQVSSIAAETAAEFSKAAKAQFSETNSKVLSLVNEATKNAPAGSENAIALFKTALGNADAGYQQFTRSAKQASDTIEANVNAAVSQFNTAVKKGPIAAAAE